MLAISDTFLCSVFAHKVKTALLLDAIQLSKLFVGTVAYLEPKWFLLILFCSGAFSVTKILIVFVANLYI
jgi:hypothetical protein